MTLSGPGPPIRKVVIEIECENDAFEPHPEVELASILRDLSDRMYDSGIVEEIGPTILDSNGYKAGTIRLVNWRR
jgi:hypothetical protein